MLENREGQMVPQVTFPTRQNGEWVDLTTDDIFKGKSVVLFALPGAFTPTCSSAHVPRYNELVPLLNEQGIDSVVCLSVNDTFVMNAWQADQEAPDILFVPDGNGEFSEQMGMLVDKTDLGFGKRSWRYSMLVRDGKIEKMFIEADVPGDPFDVSDADTMLRFINPAVRMPLDVVIFTKPGCPYCAKAKAMLQKHGISYDELTLGEAFSGRGLRAVSGAESMPQVFIDGDHVGGSEALAAWFEEHPGN